MFVTILCGDSREEIFNLNCKLINFLHHLKEKCGLDLRECVELMDSSGRVMNLEDRQHSLSLASNLLVDRQVYVPLRVCREDDKIRYVSLVNNLSQDHPELTELLRKLTNPERERDMKDRGGRRFRSKNISTNNKRHRMK